MDKPVTVRATKGRYTGQVGRVKHMTKKYAIVEIPWGTVKMLEGQYEVSHIDSSAPALRAKAQV